MRVKVSDASGPALDWMVAKCEGWEQGKYMMSPDIRKDANGKVIGIMVPNSREYVWFKPSTDLAQGGQIIDREGITTAFCSGDLGEPLSYWVATIETQSWEYGYGPYHEQDEDKSLRICKPDTVNGPTRLIAAMRCFAASKLGDEVEAPDELLN